MKLLRDVVLGTGSQWVEVYSTKRANGEWIGAMYMCAEAEPLFMLHPGPVERGKKICSVLITPTPGSEGKVLEANADRVSQIQHLGGACEVSFGLSDSAHGAEELEVFPEALREGQAADHSGEGGP